ncbi:tetratricopeptide repeat protein [Sphingomonas gellani]|uniref:tetratricopeptide repeat protein n=1 Tax=Sphingomonas gellani TaxID=1166340 RepID=UPI000B879720|nr:tetratricopeptide repeat protein [Sphingomonas gellani]
MAITPQNNQALLREVDDELRRDQLVGFWRQWGLWLMIAVVGALAAFGGWLFWQHRQQAAAGVEGEQLSSAYQDIAQDQPAKAQGTLANLAKSDSGGYRAVALQTEADILLQKKDLKGAAAKFAAIANDTSIAQPFRDLALVRQTAAEFDQLKPQVVIERLRPLTAKENPFFGSAAEMVAMAQLRAGRRDLAGQLFGQIANDKDVPDSIRQRAVQMAGAMGVDAVASNKGVKTR